MNTYLSAQQIHKCIVALVSPLFVGLSFLLQVGAPTARSEGYTPEPTVRNDRRPAH
jgi:hypothetical protein